jgi:hypothetical protein
VTSAIPRKVESTNTTTYAKTSSPRIPLASLAEVWLQPANGIGGLVMVAYVVVPYFQPCGGYDERNETNETCHRTTGKYRSSSFNNARHFPSVSPLRLIPLRTGPGWKNSPVSPDMRPLRYCRRLTGISELGISGATHVSHSRTAGSAKLGTGLSFPRSGAGLQYDPAFW